MNSLPREARLAMAVCGIAAAVIAVVVLIVAGVSSMSNSSPEPTDSAIDTTTTTTSAPEHGAEPTQPPSTGTAPIEVAVEDSHQAAPPQEPSAPASGGSPSGGSQGTGGSRPSSGTPKPRATGTSGCPAVGCNGGQGDNYTPDIDAGNGQHTVGSGPGGTAKTAPNQASQTVDLNN